MARRSVWAVLLMLVLNAYIFLKGFITLVIEPLAAGPVLEAYIAPVAGIVLAATTFVFTLREQQRQMVFTASLLPSVAIWRWLWLAPAWHTTQEFGWLVGPEVFICGLSWMTFLQHG